MDAKQVLNNLEKEVSKEIKVEKVYIYGSMARGDYHSNSDIDIAVISKDFQGLNHRERYQKIINPVRKVTKDKPVDLVCYTPKEFKRGQNSFLPEIIQEEGIST